MTENEMFIEDVFIENMPFDCHIKVDGNNVKLLGAYQKDQMTLLNDEDIAYLEFKCKERIDMMNLLNRKR